MVLRVLGNELRTDVKHVGEIELIELDIPEVLKPVETGVETTTYVDHDHLVVGCAGLTDTVVVVTGTGNAARAALMLSFELAEVIADVGDDAVGKWIAEHGVRLAVLQGAHVERDEQGEGDVVGKRELLVADGIVEAERAAPDDDPAKIPSWRASRREPAKASVSLILMTSSTSCISMVAAMKSLPMPSML